MTRTMSERCGDRGCQLDRGHSGKHWFEPWIAESTRELVEHPDWSRSKPAVSGVSHNPEERNDLPSV